MDNLRTVLDSELGYVALLFALSVIPRVLQRWHIPSAITSFGLGAIGAIGFGLFQANQTLHLLAVFGIVALFLFAGLEVEIHELRQDAPVLAQHLAVRMGLLGIVAWGVWGVLDLGFRPATLLALAVLVPSTGFILDALPSFGLTKSEVYWVKTKSIATELLALGVLFVILQSTSVPRLVLASLALVALIAILPPVFRLFAVGIVPWAPRSEFAFLLMMAIVVASVTRHLGVYYLVGAFLVGIVSRRFREALPAVASERMLHAVEVFASFFAPFYFFGAGAELRPEHFSTQSLLIGVGLTAVILPLRVGAVVLQRRLALGETMADSVRVAIPMLPTLVFTLVIAGILRDQFALPPALFGGLIVYAVLNTTVPGVLLRKPAPPYDAPELPPSDLPSLEPSP